MTPRKTLASYGTHGQSSRVFLEKGGTRIRVQWRAGGLVKTHSFPATAQGRREAKEFAQGVVEKLKGRAPAAPLTLRTLWLRYVDAEFGHLALKTQRLNTESWRHWELFNGRDTLATDCGPDTMARFRNELETMPLPRGRIGYAVSSISRFIRGVRLVYNWAESHELLVSRLHRYRFKVAKDKRPKPVPEYRAEEFHGLMRELPLTSSRHWRAGGVIRICGAQGRRQGAVRHLTPDDVDLERGRIHWDPQWDKKGKESWQPLRRDAREAIAHALIWRDRLGYTGPWLFNAPRGGANPYSAQALWSCLIHAEARAGIDHEYMRGAHGLRRMLAGDVMASTGNLRLAMQAIGDSDLRVMERYLLDREDEIEAAFEALDAAQSGETVTETVTETGGDA